MDTLRKPAPWLLLAMLLAGNASATGEFPVATRTAARILSLPLFPGITESQQERVVAALVDAVG